ncbi:unnamed protein product [Ectocarpus sp. 6 AP-2014]
MGVLYFGGGGGGGAAAGLLGVVLLFLGGISAQEAGPYEGTVAVLPGKIELENYDYGGQGVAYNDATAANEGNFLDGEPVKSGDT